jgi:cellulose synthase/poly-beta-1,6-N-acetylglucosamine synthase-like glycosyltransferase
MACVSALISASLGDPMVKLALEASIPASDIHLAKRNALINRGDFVDELLVLHRSYEQRLYAAFAAKNNLGFLADINPENLIIDTSDQGASIRHLPFVSYRNGFSEAQLLAAPPVGQLRQLLTQNFESDRLPRLRIVTPTELNKAVEVHFRDTRVREAVHSYATQHPEHSSRVTLLGKQGWFFGFVIGFVPALFMLFPSISLVMLHVLVWVFFFSCVALRLVAALMSQKIKVDPIGVVDQSTLPKYAVLVALYQETEVAAQLVGSLQQINWPQTKLQVLLICEEDDLATQAALDAAGLPANFRIVPVPNYGPRTKPKALMYALPLVEADYVVLYDAEDRPHPDQLIEAYQKFQIDGSKTGCVQAPLEVTNGTHSILTALFAFEYGALFRGLLPFLSRFNLFIPLGGTSNHFRLRTLRDVGGWDPYNVTEDADLGLRLHRYGYQTKTINRPTFEDAPEQFRIWLKQRTRWFKGHIQTWMISLRNPRALINEIGWPSFLISQIMLGGIVVSALAHPILMVSVAFMATLYFLGAPFFSLASPLAILDFINLVLGYFAFMILGYVSTLRDEKSGVWRRIIAVPPYWALLSIAAWRAMYQILYAPHEWEKTPHKPARIPN